jgi:hypothetical protein
LFDSGKGVTRGLPGQARTGPPCCLASPVRARITPAVTEALSLAVSPVDTFGFRGSEPDHWAIDLHAGLSYA